MMDKLAEKGIEERRRFLFPNWVDTDTIFPQSGHSAMRAELGIPLRRPWYSCTRVTWAKSRDSTSSLKQPGASQRKELLFILCGDGAARARLVERAKRLDNVMFMDLQPVEKLNDLLNMADIHLLPQRADVEDLVMPSKLPGIFASGKPVIATAHEGTQIARTVTGRGLVVTPGDTGAFTEAIVALSADPDLRKTIGEGARDYCVENWGMLKVLARLRKRPKRWQSKVSTSQFQQGGIMGFYSGKNVVVTGGAGFFGSFVVEKLQGAG